MPRDGLMLDNGQHILLKCYTNFLDLLHRLNAGGGVTFRDQMVFLNAQGPPDVLRAYPLPAPLRDRFGQVFALDLYTVEELRRIIAASADRLGVLYDNDVRIYQLSPK